MIDFLAGFLIGFLIRGFLKPQSKEEQDALSLFKEFPKSADDRTQFIEGVSFKEKFEKAKGIDDLVV